MSKGTKRKASEFTDEDRAEAVALLYARGWPDRKGALTEVANHLNIWPITLRRWATGQSNPPPNKIVVEKKIDLINAIRSEIADILGVMPEVRDSATYRELGTTLGILIDKVLLLQGEPTQRSEQHVTVRRSGLTTIPEHLTRRTDERRPEA